MSPRPVPLFLLAFLASSPLLRAATDFPANSVRPMTEDSPAKGLPVHPDDVPADDTFAAAGDTATRNPEAPIINRGRTQTLPSQFGMTLITPIAGTVEQRIPVSMNRGASGRMSAWSYGGEMSLQRVERDFYAYLNFNYRRDDFAFEGVPAAPWQDLDRYRISTHIEGDIGGGWGLFVDGGIEADLEKNADFGDSLTGRAAFGAKYRFSERFAYYFGLTTFTRLDRSPLIFPMAAFEIRLDRWTVRSLNGIIVSFDAYGDNSLSLDLSATFEDTFFRRSDTPSGRGRTVEFQEVPLTFGVTKELGKHGFVRGYVSTILWSDYRFATDGTTTGDFQTDPGLLFGLSAGVRF